MRLGAGTRTLLTNAAMTPSTYMAKDPALTVQMDRGHLSVAPGQQRTADQRFTDTALMYAAFDFLPSLSKVVEKAAGRESSKIVDQYMRNARSGKFAIPVKGRDVIVKGLSSLDAALPMYVNGVVSGLRQGQSIDDLMTREALQDAIIESLFFHWTNTVQQGPRFTTARSFIKSRVNDAQTRRRLDSFFTTSPTAGGDPYQRTAVDPRYDNIMEGAAILSNDGHPGDESCEAFRQWCTGQYQAVKELPEEQRAQSLERLGEDIYLAQAAAAKGVAKTLTPSQARDVNHGLEQVAVEHLKTLADQDGDQVTYPDKDLPSPEEYDRAMEHLDGQRADEEFADIAHEAHRKIADDMADQEAADQEAYEKAVHDDISGIPENDKDAADKAYAEEHALDVKTNDDDGSVPLGDEQATVALAAMDEAAEADPQILLTPENWQQQFGDENTVETPVGIVKLGKGQFEKLRDKKRTNELGMVAHTLRDPDVVFVEPSKGKKGGEPQRGHSYVFVKTFVRNGRKVTYYTSITAKIDGFEISISSHIANRSRILKNLKTLKRVYTKKDL